MAVRMLLPEKVLLRAPDCLRNLSIAGRVGFSRRRPGAGQGNNIGGTVHGW